MRVFMTILLALVSFGTSAATRVWLIGGGNTLENSQGQIEENVRWLQRLLKERSIDVRTYFTSGLQSTIDVTYVVDPEARDPILETILRVFGNKTDYATRTKRNTVPSIEGATEKAALLGSLKKDFASVGPNDVILIIYNGHGDIDEKDTTRNWLKLWGDGRMSLQEFGTILDSISPQATVRVVMTQCFSGAFSAVSYAPPYGINRTFQRRCGYFSESDRREAEGCDLSINQAEFRDFTTYFFAALSGWSRLGERIALPAVDTDGSGSVSFSEAHHYVLKYGVNSDLPRSTSEAFLERSEPWYLRWNSFASGSASSPHRDAAAYIAGRDQTPKAGRQLVEEVMKRRQARIERDGEVEANESSLRRMQTDLRNRVISRFASARTQGFWQTSDRQSLKEISEFVASLPGYRSLKELQDRQLEAMAGLLKAKRVEAQAERILWLNRIARLERYASWLPTPARRQLEQLRECESGEL